MSAIVAAASAQARSIRLMRTVRYMVDESTMLRLEILADYHEQRLAAAGRAINAASNAAGAGRVVAMRLTDCGCVEVTHGDGTTRIDPFMPWKCDPRPCAWPRPFARGADR